MRKRFSTRSTAPEAQYFWALMACCALGALLLVAARPYAAAAPTAAMAEALLEQRRQGQWLLVYGQTFFRLFLQTTLVLACGLSCLGAGLLPLVFLLLGGSILYMIQSFYLLCGFQGLVYYWAMLWLPTLCGLAVAGDLGGKLYPVALRLGKSAFWQKDEPADCRKPLIAYAFALGWCAVISAGAVLSGSVFVRLL